jgi:hypothetical protein
MRYKVHLSKSLRNNFILLPGNSPLRQSLTSSKNTYMSFDSNNVTPIKITPLAKVSMPTSKGVKGDSEDYDQQQQHFNFYFGYTGGTSSEENAVEISEQVGKLLGLREGDLV